MVPGWTERERLDTEMRRLRWLADAALSPVRLHDGLVAKRVKDNSITTVLMGVWRRGVTSIRFFGPRIVRRPARESGWLMLNRDRPAH